MFRVFLARQLAYKRNDEKAAFHKHNYCFPLLSLMPHTDAGLWARLGCRQPIPLPQPSRWITGAPFIKKNERKPICDV